MRKEATRNFCVHGIVELHPSPVCSSWTVHHVRYLQEACRLWMCARLHTIWKPMHCWHLIGLSVFVNWQVAGVRNSKHITVQADCFQWLANAAGSNYDVVILDPPCLAKRQVQPARTWAQSLWVAQWIFQCVMTWINSRELNEHPFWRWETTYLTYRDGSAEQSLLLD